MVSYSNGDLITGLFQSIIWIVIPIPTVFRSCHHSEVNYSNPNFAKQKDCIKPSRLILKNELENVPITNLSIIFSMLLVKI